MFRQTLPDPVAEIAKAPDRADFVAALVVLDRALCDAFDVGGIIVEVADQRPHCVQGMIEYGAVVGGCHVRLRELTGRSCQRRRAGPTRFPTAPLRGGCKDLTPSPARHRHCKPMP